MTDTTLAPPTDADIRAALDRVKDPCSIAANRPTGLVELGLVLGWSWPRPGHLHVRFCLTFPGCTMAPHFTEAACRDLEALPGVEGVTVEVDTAHLWTPPAG